MLSSPAGELQRLSIRIAPEWFSLGLMTRVVFCAHLGSTLSWPAALCHVARVGRSLTCAKQIKGTKVLAKLGFEELEIISGSMAFYASLAGPVPKLG